VEDWHDLELTLAIQVPHTLTVQM